MLNALNFVRGAIARKTYAPELSHFHISNNKIKSFNGMITLCSPIPLNIEATPEGAPFVKAIQACKETTTIHLTKAKRLAVKSGPFKAFINCLPDSNAELEPDGKFIELPGGLLKTFKRLHPLISRDASRKWSRGILLDGQFACVTNNVIIVQQWHPYTFPIKVNIPEEAITELLRINKEPRALQISKNSITFHFEDDRWLKANLLELEWPDVIDAILNVQSVQHEIPPLLFDAIADLMPFVDAESHMYLSKNSISTSTEQEDGSTYSIDNFNGFGLYNAKQLLLLKGVANTIDFSLYPSPAVFYGDNLRGAIVGMRA